MDEMVTAPAIRESVRFVGNVSALFAALAVAQGEFATIVKDSTATVPGKDGKTGYSFDYAGLDVVLAAVRPALARNGLAICQVFSARGEDDILTTVLAHGEGRIEADSVLPKWTKVQELGSGLTYVKRYQLLGLLGVAPADDDDGNLASGNHGAAIAPRTRPTPPAAKPAPAKPGALPADLVKAVLDAAKASGLKSKADLADFSDRHGFGLLDTQTEEQARGLLEALKGATP